MYVKFLFYFIFDFHYYYFFLYLLLELLSHSKVFKLLRKKLQVFYADFSEKNIRTSRNLSVIGPNPVAVKSVSNQVNVVNSSTSQITIPLPKDKVITNKLEYEHLFN